MSKRPSSPTQLSLAFSSSLTSSSSSSFPPPTTRRRTDDTVEGEAVAAQLLPLPPATYDLLPDILLRLPRDDLLNARLVSKSWLALTSHPSFLPRYRALHPSSMLGLFYCANHLEDEDERPGLAFAATATSPDALGVISRGDFSLGFLPLPDHGNFYDLDLVNSSHGLLLLADITRTRYLVCNPATREWAELPRPRLQREYTPFPDGLICPPGEPRCFQVIRVHFSRPGVGPFDVEIFSSDSWAWTAATTANTVTYSHPYKLRGCTTNLVDGVVYWWHGLHHALAYDLRTSHVSVIDVPGLKNYHVTGWMGISEGRLCFAQARWTGPCVWTLVGCYPDVEWSLKHQVSWPKKLRWALWGPAEDDAADALFGAKESSERGLSEGMFKVMEDNRISLIIKVVAFHCDNARIIHLNMSGTMFSLHLYTGKMMKLCGDKDHFLNQITPYELPDSPVPIPMDRKENNSTKTSPH